VADAQNHRIRAVQSGRVVTVAGLGVPGFRDGDAATAMFHLPAAVAVGADGVLYVADHGNHRIRAIENGVVRTVAGTGRPGWTDGPPELASFANPSDLAFGPDGRLYVADAVNGAIRAITLGAASRVDTFAGR
jgi:sugar lactone lactonase YvrE